MLRCIGFGLVFSVLVVVVIVCRIRVLRCLLVGNLVGILVLRCGVDLKILVWIVVWLVFVCYILVGWLVERMISGILVVLVLRMVG